MGIISVEQADRLYWLGRYAERVYTTVCMYANSFDHMIDEVFDSYPQYCRDMDIPNIYTDKEDFFRRYPFDPENPDSIISNLNRAYDNAIVLRESIGSETLAFIQLAIYDMNKAASSSAGSMVVSAPMIEMQKTVDHLLAFWGLADDRIDSEEIRNILKAGKRIERIDLYARLGMPQKEMIREVKRMIPRVERSGLKYDPEQLKRLEEMVEAPEIDYYGIVYEVERIF